MMRNFVFLASATLVACTSSSSSNSEEPDAKPASEPPQSSSEKPTAKAPEGQLDDTVKPVSYRLALTLEPAEKTFSGSVQIDVEFSRETDVFFIHGSALDVQKFSVKQQDTSIDGKYEQVGSHGIAEITLEKPVKAGLATLSVEYTAPFSEQLQGIYRVVDDGVAYAFSQFEATSARFAFPSFDEPRFKTPFDIEVTAAADHAVITTTPEVDTTKTDDGMVRHRFQRTQPLPTYLIAFAVGPLDVVDAEPIPATAIRDRPIPLRGVATRGKGERLGYALRNTAILVTTLEEYFGIPYPYEKLDIIAAPDFAFGAMENVGAIIYREQLLLLDQNSPLDQRRRYFLTHSHELAHQWFGNLVTPKWWTDIWLNESFATWMGNRTATTAKPKDSFDLQTLRSSMATMGSDSLASARRIREPITRDADIWDAFDSITYRKGGGILAMFESYLGDEAFRAGVRRHMERFAHGVADADDFSQSLADGSNRPEVIPAFRSFIEQPGVPRLTIALSCNENQGSLAVTQSRYKPLASSIDPESTWGVPFCFATWNKKGKRTDRCELLSESKETIALDSCPAAVLPNARGAGYYHFIFDGSGREALMKRFAKLELGEQLAVFSSIRAGFRAGEVTLPEMMEVVELAARSKAWEVQLAPLPLLNWMADNVPTLRDAVQRKVNKLYAQRALRLGLRRRKTPNRAEVFLRPPLVGLVAEVGKNPRLRAKLQPVAERALAGKSRADERPVVPTALRVYAEDNGDVFLKRALERLKSERDGYTRGELVAGIGAVPEAQLDDVFNVMFGEPFRLNESLGIIGQLFANAEHRDRAMMWMSDEFDKITERFPTQLQPRIIGAAGSLCDEDGFKKFDAMNERIAEVDGAELSYTQARETIELCIALRDHIIESTNENAAAR